MEDMKWESIVLDVNEYLEAATDLEDGLAQVLRLNLQIGTNNPSEREASHMALKALLRGEMEHLLVRVSVPPFRQQ